jgi:hypothetical protein
MRLCQFICQFNTDENSGGITETALPPYTPIPARRQKTFKLSSGKTSAVIDILQRIPDSDELVLLAQVCA